MAAPPARVKAACGRNRVRIRCALMAQDPEREKRLAEALRANLRRRKAQQRATDDADDPQAGRDEPKQD